MKNPVTTMKNPVLFLSATLLLSLQVRLDAQDTNTFRIDSQAQWEEWSFPLTTLGFNEDGSITPLKLDAGINASLSATNFTHNKLSTEKRGGIRQAGSNPGTAANVMDGDPGTYWQPDPDSDLQDWVLEIDLGRAVPATLIRLRFPDQEGARPLREFRVFTTDGKLQSNTQEIFVYDLVGGTTSWNEETVVEFPLSSGTAFNRGIYRSGAAAAETDTSSTFVHLQYVRILGDAKSADAAISEVEVITYAENLALGLIERGGSVSDQDITGRASSAVDGDVNTSLNVNREVGKKLGGVRYDWDLGAVYFVTRAMFLADQTQSTWTTPGFSSLGRILTSDGRLAPKQAPPGEPPAIDYDIEFDYLTTTEWGLPEHLAYFFQPHKRMRHLSLQWDINTGGLSIGALAETAIYATGHVAEVRMESDFIQIADRAVVLKNLRWEADLPEGTRILASTRSGNTFDDVTIYYDRNGVEVSAEEFDGMRKSKRGPTESVVAPGQDWSSWSNVYQFSGQKFLSPSPRQYVQFRVMMATDRPDVAPTLKSFELDFADAFLAGALARVSPNRAVPGVPETFTYTLMPSFRRGDTGFNRILVLTPAEALLDSLAIRVAGNDVEPVSVNIMQDSLIVVLDEVVQRSEVELDIHVPILQNPYLFNGFVGHTDEPELWQLVDESERFAVTVFLPQIADSNRLLDDLSIQPEIITPNGDGTGDGTEIRFAVFKTDTRPQVRIYSMAGDMVSELDGGLGPDGMQLYTWSGKDRTGATVTPGIYLCRIKIDSQANSETLARVINVAY